MIFSDLAAMKPLALSTYFFLVLLFLTQTPAAAYGPLLGHVDMRTAYIVFQSAQTEEVVLRYYPEGQPTKWQHLNARTSDDIHHVHRFILTGLEPGTTYNYQIASAASKGLFETTYSFTTQALWQYRTDPPALRVVAGSCAFINETAYDRPGNGYGGNYPIFDSIVAQKPNMMLWLGDNIYLREVDYNSAEGIALRYQHARKLPELQHLLSACPNYAIWDDHDFGPNDSNGSYALKDAALEAFNTYWANPSSGTSDTRGIFTSFAIGDIDFFLLDNRYHKMPADLKGLDAPTLLGDEQLTWLIAALKSSKAPFKMVALGGQFLNTHVGFENYSTYAAERQKIIDLIELNDIKNVVFLTGDRHCGELSMLTLKNGNVIYDLTTSPLTSRSYDISKENNTLRLDGTLVPTQHFAILDFSGPLKGRTLTITIKDHEGKIHYSRTISSIS
jgi:alkaline phosphatase D